VVIPLANVGCKLFPTILKITRRLPSSIVNAKKLSLIFLLFTIEIPSLEINEPNQDTTACLKLLLAWFHYIKFSMERTAVS